MHQTTPHFKNNTPIGTQMCTNAFAAYRALNEKMTTAPVRKQQWQLHCTEHHFVPVGTKSPKCFEHQNVCVYGWDLLKCSCYVLVSCEWKVSHAALGGRLIYITLSSKLKSTEHTELWHITVYLPADRTITSWFWQSFAAGVSKETVPKVLVEERGNAC